MSPAITLANSVLITADPRHSNHHYPGHGLVECGHRRAFAESNRRLLCDSAQRALRAWLATGPRHASSASDFDLVNLTFDLAADTIDFSFFRTLGATTYHILNTASSGGNMDYLAFMGLFMQAENAKNLLDDFDFSIASVPEPAILPLIAIGLMGIGLSRRKIN